SIVWAGIVLASLYGAGEVPEVLPIAAGVLANVGLWLGYGVGPVLVARVKGRGPVADYGAWVRPGDVPIGLLIGVLTQVVVLPVLYWPLLRLVDGDPSESARRLVEAVDGPAEWALFALSVAVVAPFVEELFYRGLLLRAVQSRLGTAWAIVISSAVFAVVHRQVLPLPGLFVFGVGAALLTVRTGRLGPAWAMHVGFNAATLVVLGVGL
ncbi:MAG: CPBP family intramembrane metalloprotease, partial [Acidimicrobiia bacterium]|nr:CPBP family intramembrane metalloprotease [Acidimicrobiia bacterium]